MYVHKFVVGITALLVLITVNVAHERKREALQYQAELKEAAGKYNQLIVEYNRLVEENDDDLVDVGPQEAEDTLQYVTQLWKAAAAELKRATIMRTERLSRLGQPKASRKAKHSRKAKQRKDHAEPQPVAASATPLIEAEAGLKAANHQKAVYSKPRCNESTRGTKASLSVATVNLWNTNPPWDARRDAIVKDLKRLSPTVIAFQEVRVLPDDPSSTQLAQLTEKLGPPYDDHGHSATAMVQPPPPPPIPPLPRGASAADVKKWKAKKKRQEERKSVAEGVGLISRYPVVRTDTYDVSPGKLPAKITDGARTNGRVLLAAELNYPGTKAGKLFVFVTHLTTDDAQQCAAVLQLQQVAALPQWSSEGVPQILLGDFNAYFDFPWPMLQLTHPGHPALSRLAPCPAFKTISTSHQSHKGSLADAGANTVSAPPPAPFFDAWEMLVPPDTIRLKDLQRHPNPLGNTFPAWVDGREAKDASRPDRIFFNPQGEQLKVCSMETFLGGEIAPGVWPSDHRGVIARVLLGGGQ